MAKVTQNVAPLHITNAPAKFEVATCKGFRRYIYKKVHYFTLTPNLDFLFKVNHYVAQYPPYQIIYVPAEFEFASSNGFEGMHLQEKKIII